MKKNQKKNIFLLGADTGGHVVPVFALAKELEQDSQLEVFVLGVGSEIEKNFYSKLLRSKYIKIIAGKSSYGSLLTTLFSYIKLFIGFFQSVFLLMKYRPKVIFLKGNYATLPMAFAARIFGYPIINHESDAVIGRSNRIISKFSKKLFLSFPLEKYDRVGKNFVYSGSVLRKEFSDFSSPSNNEYQSFIFTREIPIILILGGSLGAENINRCILKNLDKLTEKYQIIHQTGNKGIYEAEKHKSNLDSKKKKRYYCTSFIDNKFLSALRISNLVISRSGSGIFEIAAFKKASILIPYPHATNNHQELNARFFTDQGAAVLLLDNEINSGKFLDTIKQLLSDETMLKQIGDKFYQSAKINGLDVVIFELKEYLK